MKSKALLFGLVAGVGLMASQGALAAMGQEEAMDLARKSGCLACHGLDRKVVGPAWSDVSKRYKGNELQAIKAELIEKVQAGGKGNWTEVTGGVPMPPYGPRVPAQDIEQLVDFVLSIARE